MKDGHHLNQPKIINRRDFLKALGVIPFAFTKWDTPKSSATPSPRNTSLPNVLILVFDALTARNMSLYGYPRATTPNLEKYVQKATVFHRHYASGNFTTSGTASLLTGVYPWTHHALHLHGQPLERFADNNLFSLLQDSYFTFSYTHNPMVYILLQQFRNHIAQLKKISDLCLISDSSADQWLNLDYKIAYDAELLLLRNGYHPPASLLLSLIDWTNRVYQNLSLMQEYKDIFPRSLPNYLDEEPPSFLYFTLEQAIDWLQAQIQTCPKPFLGYVHFLPPHGPYTTRKEFGKLFCDNWKPIAKPESFFTEGYSQEFLDEQRRYYDQSIAYIDAEFGRLYDFMQSNGLADNTYLIITSDHGEMFERGIFTHITAALYEPIIHIPLIIFQPGQQNRENVYSPTNAVDMLPTLLTIANKPIPNWCNGQVLPMTQGQSSHSNRCVYSIEAKENPKNAPLRKSTVTQVKENYKLIYYMGYQGCPYRFELFDLASDPEELVNLYAPGNPISSAMENELISQLAEANQPFR